MYIDECHLHTHPHLAKMCQRCGIPHSIPTAGVDQKITIFGALEYRSGCLTTMVAKRATSVAFQEFVQTVVSRWPSERLALVLDNASSHKSAALRH